MELELNLDLTLSMLAVAARAGGGVDSSLASSLGLHDRSGNMIFDRAVSIILTRV